MPVKISNFQKLLSYLYPIEVESDYRLRSQPLKLVLRSGSLQLLTTDTIYSNGLKYRPFSQCYPHIYPIHPLPKKMLLLGGGLGSALLILHKKYSAFPETTIVEINPVIRNWAQKYIFGTQDTILWKTESAEKYLVTNTQKFHLIGVDVFTKLTPLDFIYHADFLLNLKQACSPSGFVIINTITPSSFDITVYLDLLKTYFTLIKHISEGKNHYIILRTHN